MTTLERIAEDPTSEPAIDLAPPAGEVIRGFIDAIRGGVAWPRAMPRWWKTQAHRLTAGLCGFCGQKMDEIAVPLVLPIIPTVSGGPHHSEAVAPSCTTCRKSGRHRDLLFWFPGAPAALKQRRLRWAMRSLNHLPHPDAAPLSVSATEQLIAQRWSKPRFTCWAQQLDQGGLIGWPSGDRVPAEAHLLLRFEHGATRLDVDSCQHSSGPAAPVVMWVEDANRFRRAIWDLIDQNAWIRCAEGRSLTPHRPLLKDADDWGLVFNSAACNAKHQKWRSQDRSSTLLPEHQSDDIAEA